MIGGVSDADLDEILGLLPRLYEAVGWNEDRQPDWKTFRGCCHSQAVLVPLGNGTASPMPVETFIGGMEAQRTSGALKRLSEREISRHVEAFGNLANVRSGFVASIEGVERRGVTFAHIVREGGRWQILTAVWENENDERPLPANFS